MNETKTIMKLIVISGALFAFSGVVLGAFAAHVLRQRLTPDMFAIFEVGVRYHIYHALALFAVGWTITQFPESTVHFAGYFFIIGILIFSGSLYLLSLTGLRWLGAITPIGGVSFLVGWIWLAWAIWKAA
jgi:uncharacterized membrane protein YgdD (TMEM256/DUF423 family)